MYQSPTHTTWADFQSGLSSGTHYGWEIEDDETDPVLRLEEENALLKRRLAALERRHESVLSRLGQLKSDVETLGLLCLQEFMSVQGD